MSGQRGKVLGFGPFELSIENRLLTNGAKVVPLGARAMDLLIVLVEQANKVVGRRTLIERVWPSRGAEQVSLRVHIWALRKALDQSAKAAAVGTRLASKNVIANTCHCNFLSVETVSTYTFRLRKIEAIVHLALNLSATSRTHC
jgi:two-component SAPR family response regulator